MFWSCREDATSVSILGICLQIILCAYSHILNIADKHIKENIK